WQRNRLDPDGDANDYLDRKADYPVICDLAVLDRHLSGLTSVHESDVGPIADILTAKVWAPRELREAVERHIAALPGQRLKFIQPLNSSLPAELLSWCTRQMLMSGCPLPIGLGHQALAEIAQSMRAEWVSPLALARLDQLGLPSQGVDQVCQWLLDGHLSPPSAIDDGSLVAAVNLFMRRHQPLEPLELARCLDTAYRHHERLTRLAGSPWRAYLDQVACAKVRALPNLPDVLRDCMSAQWLVVDCLAVTLSEQAQLVLTEELEGWELDNFSIAQVSETTTTDGHFRHLLEAGIDHAYCKIDCVDELVHRAKRGFSDLQVLAATELRLAVRAMRGQFDSARPLLVFADHGFRLAADGKKYRHGGASTIERMVPVWHFGPRVGQRGATDQASVHRASIQGREHTDER
ncbi:MAG: hypothetical protein HOI95_07915, partial [Chromatiales bacterium]|nr:hypothetical protein [Chromatiales bacterium]